MNKYEFNTDELINEEEFMYDTKEKVSKRRRQDWVHAKRKKAIADQYGVDITGGVHRFMKNNLSSLETSHDYRKVKAFNKKYYDSLDEMRLEEATKDYGKEYPEDLEETTYTDHE